MLRAIQFNGKFCFCTIKVYNKKLNDALFVNFNRLIPQKRIPELSFLRCHFMAEFFGAAVQTAVIGEVCNRHNEPQSSLSNGDHLLLVAVISDVLYLSTFCSQNVHK